MNKYSVKVGYHLQSQVMIEADSEQTAKTRAVSQLGKSQRRPNIDRKIKQEFSNIAAESAVADQPPFYKVHIHADVIQTLLIYGGTGEVAKATGETQVANSYREQPGQISFATDIEAISAKIVTD